MTAPPAVTLITGGARSGKSRYALDLAARFARRAFVAAAEPVDEEMRERIRRHRAERGEGWTTIEEPADLAGALDRLPAGTEVAVVDCLTVWLGNLLHRAPEADVNGEPSGPVPVAGPAAAGPVDGAAGGPPDESGADRPVGAAADPAAFPEIAAFLARLETPPCALIVVTNEVGWGIVPENPVARAFRDLAGRVNEEVARRAARVVLMVAGRPLELPGGRGG